MEELRRGVAQKIKEAARAISILLDFPFWHLAEMPPVVINVRYLRQRLGNRPTGLWIAEDFGCCASG
jgi:hypothetical protein